MSQSESDPINLNVLGSNQTSLYRAIETGNNNNNNPGGSSSSDGELTSSEQGKKCHVKSCTPL